MKYNYKVYFRLNDSNCRYIRVINVDAKTNNEAKILGEKEWKKQVNENNRLKDADVVKITCRRQETGLRSRQKLSPLEKALSCMNSYINEELN